MKRKKCGRRRNSRSEEGMPTGGVRKEQRKSGVMKEDLQRNGGVGEEDLQRKGVLRKEELQRRAWWGRKTCRGKAG